MRSFGGKTPRIAESAFVSEAAYIVGDVEIGEGASVWPGAVVRSEGRGLRVGRNSHIEDNSVVHGGVQIGDNVIVGHGTVINCRSIGNNVLIGMNATLLQGAVIGNFCMIGAGCLVSQDMEVPDNSLVVGVPAKIQGEVTQEQVRRWLQGAPEHYAQLAKQYKEQGL
ncbi:MAG: gamma carbonic anhydrase family protein [Chloroflexi bacterium]|nr:gamma carbonic anhydrase family protein [Chloroflexota bacterium]